MLCSLYIVIQDYMFYFYTYEQDTCTCIVPFYCIVLVVHLHLLSKDVCVFLISKVTESPLCMSFFLPKQLLISLDTNLNCYLYTYPN